MGGWVNVQHTLALESYKHNNNYFFLIEKHFFLVVLIFLNFSFLYYYFFKMFFRGLWHFFYNLSFGPPTFKKQT